MQKSICVRERERKREKEGDIRTSAAVGDFYLFYFFLLLARGFSPGGVSSYLIDAQRLHVRYHKPGELPVAAPRR